MALAEPETAPELTVERVQKRFRGLLALDGVSLRVRKGEIVGLIGPNGAGKTTLFNLITRLYGPDQGEIAFEGRSLLRTPPHKVVRLGIARTFQNVALFPNLSVLDNVALAIAERLGVAPRKLRAASAHPVLRQRPC